MHEGDVRCGNKNKTLSLTIVGHTRMRTMHHVQNKQLDKGLWSDKFREGHIYVEIMNCHKQFN